MKKERIVRYTRNNLPEDNQTDWKHLRSLTDDEIDRSIAEDSDAAPIVDDTFLEQVKLAFMESSKTRITIRIDTPVLAYFKQLGPGYQKKINTILKAYVQSQLKHS